MSDLRIGQLLALPVNLLRLIVALAGLTLIGFFGARHLVVPTDAPPVAWKWLLISGVVGFFIGDLALFRAFVIMGARLCSLTQTLAAPLAAVAALILLPQKHMTMSAWIGMVVTLLGIIWVITERAIDNEPAGKIARRATPFGLFLGFIGAAGQGVGLTLTDVGMKSFDHPFAANQIRVIAGVITFGLFVILIRDVKRVISALRDPTAVFLLILGAITGPILGVSILMKAMSLQVQPGVAQTLASLVPIFIIPVVVIRGKEHITWRAVAGAVVAVAGVAILLNA
jgi:drug/metabolite transporter (DMT)-like permease